MNYKNHLQCRVCGNNRMTEYIDLGQLPLSNNLCLSPIEMPERYPLKVLFCDQCKLSQLSIVVDPEILFGHYVYRSSINEGYKKHCHEMALSLKGKYGLSENSFHIDIAGNDGALLSEFQKVLNHKILNVDPAVNLGAICQAKGIPTLTYFWSQETARRCVNGFGKADLITATNVFAHVDDVHDFMEGVNIALKDDGVLVLEFPYLLDFIDKNEFDTIYFEHLSYFSIYPLNNLCKQHGLRIINIERFPIHGGSVRVHIGINKQKEIEVSDWLISEFEYGIEKLASFNVNSLKVIHKFRFEINRLKNEGNKIAAFAASAKGNTLLNCAGITIGSIGYIIDETPEKIGKYYPGTFIPIVSMLELKENPPDYLVILSWNFAEEIISKCRAAGYRGRFILPLTFEII